MRSDSAILVTGAAAGIGLSTARHLVASGRRVVGADCDHDALAKASAMLGPSFSPCHVDLADAEAAEALAARAAQGGGLGGIVHSAGLFPQRNLADTSTEMWDRVMAVNLRAAFLLAREGARVMRNGGSLVFLTSGAGRMAAAADPFQRGFTLYGASKAGLDRLAAGVAVELAAIGIAVVLVTPGAFVDTPGTAQVDLAAVAATMPRIGADHVGRAVAWLAAAPRLEHAGGYLDACRFGRTWGPGARQDSLPQEKETD